MDTLVLKFGGSSVADNVKLNIVAEKIIELYNQNNNIVAVISAQGKTTDRLIKEANELSAIPNDREMDMLLSTGEQVSIAKLAILLDRLGYNAISLTGWQAGIYTSITNQNAIIENINTERIQSELDKRNIVIIAGFQGINENLDITTLGRGGSDTTAVAVAAAINAKHCYIFSDVDGVYSTDPNKITIAKKLENVSFKEMLEASSEGAKVLHNRCVEIAQKYDIPIIAKSTFNNKDGTVISDKIEGTTIKTIVKSDDILTVDLSSNKYSNKDLYYIFKKILEEGIVIKNLTNNSNEEKLNLAFNIKKAQLNKFDYLIDTEFNDIECKYNEVSKICIIGYGLMNNNTSILDKIITILQDKNYKVINFDISEIKISITFNSIIEESIVEKIHEAII